MSLFEEQLGPNRTRRNRKAVRRWQKNQMTRRLRRAAKRNPEDAPEKRRYRGWP